MPPPLHHLYFRGGSHGQGPAAHGRYEVADIHSIALVGRYAHILHERSARSSITIGALLPRATGSPTGEGGPVSAPGWRRARSLWYVFHMATTKITVTLEDEQLREIREYVRTAKASSVSAFVKHAVGVALFEAAGWRASLDEALQQTGGQMTAEERAWADSVLLHPETTLGVGNKAA